MLAALLACHLFFTPSDAKFAYSKAEELVADYTPRDSGTIRGRFAANYIFDSLQDVGAHPKQDKFAAKTPKGYRFFTNIYAEWVSDPEMPWIILISHFDTKSLKNCPGANDGASTTGLLIAIAQILSKNSPNSINIALQWLDGEECMIAYRKNDGFWGSNRAAEQLASSGRNVKAVICLDMLGDKDLNISIPRNTTDFLRNIALQAAFNTGYSHIIHESNESIKDDHIAFLNNGFPAIDLIDFEFGSESGLNDYWHTNEDTIDKISVGSLTKAGSIAVEMINLLSK